MMYIKALDCQASPELAVLFASTGHLDPMEAIEYFTQKIIEDPVVNQKDYIRLVYVFRAQGIESMLTPGLGHLMILEDFLQGEEEQVKAYLQILLSRLKDQSVAPMAVVEVLRLINSVTTYYYAVLHKHGKIGVITET